MQEQTSVTDWRDEIAPKTATLKVLDGEKVIVVFKNEGKKVSSVDYGDSIAFLVIEDNVEYTWYVKANNFDLLGQIKALGKLTGLRCEISRVGSKKSDTRYSIKKL